MLHLDSIIIFVPFRLTEYRDVYEIYEYTINYIKSKRFGA